jgi:uncharacterized RDD family membrane protein YckC
MAYAGFWLRVVAAIIDGVIVEIVVLAVSFGIGYGMGSWGAGGDTAGVVGVLLGLVIGIVYWCGMESSARQATLGKMAVGIKVTDLNGNRISFGRALGRYFAKIISAIILLIGFLMVAWTEKKQGLHDKIAGTLVVKKGAAA